MIGVTRQAVACDFRIDLRTACLCMLVLFEHDDGGAFTHDEAIPVLVIGARGLFRRIIEIRGHSLGSAEPCDTDAANDSLGAACNHDIRIAIFDEAGRVTDRVSAGSTGRHHRMVRPFEFVPDRYLARGQIDQSSRDEERAHLARPALMKRDRSLVDRFKTTNTGPDENASALLTFVILGLPSGILYSFVCCSDRIKNEFVDPTHLFWGDEFGRIKRMGISFAAAAACYPRNLKRNLARHIFGIERINTSSPRFAFKQALPGCLTASGQG